MPHVRAFAARALRGGLKPLPRLGRYAPRSTLVLPQNLRDHAAEPAIDFHTHIGRWLSSDGSWMEPDVSRLLHAMDQCNVRAAVNLDGRFGTELDDNLNRYDRAHPGRFATFCHVDWSVCRADRFDELQRDLERSLDQGAKGLKVWKDLGRSVRDRRGDLVMPDDERLNDLWTTVGRAGVPVLIHTADPVAHFHPTDRHNERLEELHRYPGATWNRSGLPTHTALMTALERLVSAHRDTTFVAAHVAGWTENLEWVENLLERNPNVSVDISARVGDLGRQPRAAARLIERHSSQVLFGTDIFPWRTEEVAVYFRFLETADEYFPYAASEHPAFGRWRISGVELEQSTLSALYRLNAERLLPSLCA
jgi:predicted TIM-barrel fold metal-dependent hydrolase